jgi:hypothetical protein
MTRDKGGRSGERERVDASCRGSGAHEIRERDARRVARGKS